MHRLGGSRARRSSHRNGRRGVTLIMVAAVLAILAGLATGFYVLMVAQTKSATRYADAVRADMMARAGIDFAIAQLRDQSFKKTEDPTDPWYMFDYLRGHSKSVSFPESDLLYNAVDDDKDGLVDNLEEAKFDLTRMKAYSRALSNSAQTRENDSDRYTLNVFDAASRINVNACDNLGFVLDSLCRVIGAPLISAEETRLIPRVWEWYGGNGYNTDPKDWPKGGTQGGPVSEVQVDIYYELGQDKRPLTRTDGSALYGDGFAIAGYRARNGRLKTLTEVKQALTYVERNNDGKPDHPLEQLELEVKFAAIRDYITVDSWVDTTTSCVGKFEWTVTSKDSSSGVWDLVVDRDKSWIPDDPKNDPENRRGSLRGCYLAIINGHGAGQLRRIKTNGIDWVQIETFETGAGQQMGFAVPPGPTSSYVIIAMEDSKLACHLGGSISREYHYYTNPPPTTMLAFPDTDSDGNFIDDPLIDYRSKPLCIHRAPVNVNTASDKVLAALLMGLNVTHGHFMSIGTDVDMQKLASWPLKPRAAWTGTDSDWKIADHPTRKVAPFVITPKGLKRIPADSGRYAYDLNFQTFIKSVLPPEYNMDYLNNHGRLDPKGTTNISEVQELVFRILIARQSDTKYPYFDAVTGKPMTSEGANNYKRGPFVSWDDFYFRVVRPWDDNRLDSSSPRYDPRRGSVARLIMAAFNPNMDILKFNPNIEWIDRWGRNFTEMEPVMVYTNQPEQDIGGSLGHGALDSAQANVNERTADLDGYLTDSAVPFFTRERSRGNDATSGGGSLYAVGPYGTDPKYMGTYVTRSFRYKTDEMIDKTDLNRSSTEFSFDSRGIYEITSTGEVSRRGEVLAERKIQALVKVYDVWSESSQRDFVKGYISRAADMPARPSSGTSYSGSIGRDCSNQRERLALTTLPEPLVPLRYTIDNPKNEEVVTPGGSKVKLNGWGMQRPMNVPDVVGNFVQPAGYDGQIVLATNTLRYDPTEDGDRDSFLASFNGDLDTDTSRGNGREQAKSPLNSSVRVLDTCGLLGLLNDPWIDTDPGLRGTTTGTTHVEPDLPPYSGLALRLYRFDVMVNALRGLHPGFYWNNVSCRQGDLRPDGVWVGGPGMSGNEGVMKYLAGDDSPSKYNEQNLNLNGEDARRDVSAGQMAGVVVSMWAKPAWHHNDNHTHEFFDASTPGWADGGIRSKAFWLRKQGIVQYAIAERASGSIAIGSITPNGEGDLHGISVTANRVNDLMFGGEFDQNAGDRRDPDYCIFLHGGESGVPYLLDSSKRDLYEGPLETASYHFQPFRWSFVGMRIKLPSGAPGKTIDSANLFNGPNPSFRNGSGRSGMFRTNSSELDSRWMAGNVVRPFVDNERFPEGNQYNPDNKYWTTTQIQSSTAFSDYQRRLRAGELDEWGSGGGQPVRYRWAHPGGIKAGDEKPIYEHIIFGLNNCNPGRDYGTGISGTTGGKFTSIYRAAPEDGTFAVIDEYKISRKETMLTDPEPTKDRITRPENGEMTLSRYYMPPNPINRGECPTFTSQTMLQSMRGNDKRTQKEPEYVTVARVNWTAFTPRFMSQDKHPSRFKMLERIQGQFKQVAYRGPFHYRYYNGLSNLQQNLGQPEEYDDAAYNEDGTVMPYRCARPTPAQYQKYAGDYKAEKDYHATRGIEVELLEDSDDDAANGGGKLLGKGMPFTNPNINNRVVSGQNQPVKVRADRLRYQVRFRYPVDKLADPDSSGGKWVDPATQYIVDTPVFDDISITYFTKPRILDFRDLME